MAEDLTEFSDFGLDHRLSKAIEKCGWKRPTPIQAAAIPIALQGKDILARARTGSGKTAAYAIPAIQKLLTLLDRGENEIANAAKILILVPTKELSRQACNNIKDLTTCCSHQIQAINVSSQDSSPNLRTQLLSYPHIVIGTPTRILTCVKSKSLDISQLEMLVIDEADLIFSFNFENDLKSLLVYLPNICQSMLLSATLSDDVKSLRKLVLHNPVVLKLQESQLPEQDRLDQYFIKCNEEDKFLLIYAMFKLGLIEGKSILFINTINRCYRLKLYLEQFSIKCCVLNSELPQNSRYQLFVIRSHIIDEFNRGIYDIIIASDETVLNTSVRTNPANKISNKGKRRHKDSEFGVSRGVKNIINFDFPKTPESYIHRVGRTARGDDVGSALSLVTSDDETLLKSVQDKLSEDYGNDDAAVVKPYTFKMNEIESFRYRAQDALRAVTKNAVRDARLREIKKEMLNSEKLKTYFGHNPKDMQALRHDLVLHPAKVRPHLKNVPDYLGKQNKNFNIIFPSFHACTY
ncbi:putative ATP-dependent RNA helicase DDX56 [Trichoplax sp. H2]|nr:putative ATP-dependent RNA helicase DDX56 [Trichoplax sp. H2]|eukprot:RDD38777.1 putative ATP-dependent RNA helicase DDX56 [Trichoplax sp. H2]